MSSRSFEVTASIDNTPETVMAYVADVRNRPLFIKNLRSVSEVQGSPGPGSTWKWTFSVLGLDFEGEGRCIAYEPGRRLEFDTDGGIRSHWCYTAAPEGDGTRLSLRVEYDVPPGVKLPAEDVLVATRKSAGEDAIANLKTILDR